MIALGVVVVVLTMINNIEPLECPFCGRIEAIEQTQDLMGSFSIICHNCGAQRFGLTPDGSNSIFTPMRLWNNQVFRRQLTNLVKVFAHCGVVLKNSNNVLPTFSANMSLEMFTVLIVTLINNYEMSGKKLDIN